MAPVLKPFQLLEINIISGQDLEPVSKKMRTYAKAWVHPNRKLSSSIDGEGNNNPTWNDKFVFRVDEEFLRRDTAAVMIEIYSVHWFRDILAGTVRVLIGNLIPPPARSHHGHHNVGMRCVALQVRRPSGRPQGILNIGVALLDSSMRSMPLYTQSATSAVGYRDFMDDPPSLQQLQKENQDNKNKPNNAVDDANNNNNSQPFNVKPILLRSKSERSERSERVTFDIYSPKDSVTSVAVKESSILSITESQVDPFRGMKKKGKASSVISGAELRNKPKHKGKKSKASSVLSDSILSKESSHFLKIQKSDLKQKEPKIEKVEVKAGSDQSSGTPTNKVVDEKSITIAKEKPQLPLPTIGRPLRKFNGHNDFSPSKGAFTQGKYVIGAPLKGNSIWSDSEVGPSPSEVAAVMAQKRYPLDDNQSSVLDGWSMDESVEGLRSKLERWRTELPPLYDRGLSTSSYKSSSQHTRRHTDGGSGLLSCFGNIYGYECQCVCGKPSNRRNASARFHSPLNGTTPGRSFL